MQIADSIALVTGSNRGLGFAFVRALNERGARKIYATARKPSEVDVPGVEILELDITDPVQVARAAEQASDVSLLINNAGVTTYQGLTTGEMEKIRLEMDTHFFGTLNVVRAFAPVLATNGGGAILNVLSVASWLTFPGVTASGAAKAAEWSLTDGIRLELAAEGTLVHGLHVGAIDTDAIAGWDVPKNDPGAVARAGLEGLEAGRSEVLVDDAAVQAKAGLATAPHERYADALKTAR
jgi:NAD(P)-dependent dehydrogenase (short-subunit alcohol dehydrogenase family)